MKKIVQLLTNDISAGIAVFLVALPLCIGIALAANAPILSGIIAGIVAGLVVSIFSGSELSVSGPAAGLIVIVSAAIESTGGFEVFLCAVVLAGCLQILMGFLRLGFISSLFPSSVISGMMAAIGILIILKQIPHALGYDLDFEGDESFWQFLDHGNTFTAISAAAKAANPGIIIVALLAMFTIWLWNRKKSGQSLLDFLPGSLIAVLVAVAVNEFFKMLWPTLHIQPEHLVQIPVIESFSGLVGSLHFPTFAMTKWKEIVANAVIISIIASLETLLSVEAIDKLDFNHRLSDKNKELKAQGIGNIFCGLIGGIPMTSVILRSSANIYAGAKSRLSVVVHGILLLLTVITIPSLLNKIPLAALAAILFSIGYKLANFAVFKKFFQLGVDQFCPFIATILAILTTDLLTGVLIGLGVSMIFVIITNYHSSITVVNDGSNYLLRFTKDVSFINKLKLEKELNKIPDNTHVMLDGTNAMFIDKDIYSVIEDFTKRASLKGIKVNAKNMLSKSLNVVLFGKKEDAILPETAPSQQSLGQRKKRNKA